jgi:Fur family transcriptional regulator, peroxide stress response regulator
MRRTAPIHLDPDLNERLAMRGFRFTPQREQVYAVLLRERDHPTAEEVFIRAKREMPDISMATVYNCLDALVKCGLARQVTLERGATRFCPNMREHGHFYCDGCKSIFDIPLPSAAGIELPEGYRAERYDVAVHGRCPACAGGALEGAEGGTSQRRELRFSQSVDLK